jgi:hypothetical protein
VRESVGFDITTFQSFVRVWGGLMGGGLLTRHLVRPLHTLKEERLCPETHGKHGSTSPKLSFRKKTPQS